MVGKNSSLQWQNNYANRQGKIFEFLHFEGQIVNKSAKDTNMLLHNEWNNDKQIWKWSPCVTLLPPARTAAINSKSPWQSFYSFLFRCNIQHQQFKIIYLYFLSMLYFWYIFVCWSHYLVRFYPFIIPRKNWNTYTYFLDIIKCRVQKNIL